MRSTLYVDLWHQESESNVPTRSPPLGKSLRPCLLYRLPKPSCNECFYPMFLTKPGKIYSGYYFKTRGPPYTCPRPCVAKLQNKESLPVIVILITIFLLHRCLLMETGNVFVAIKPECKHQS